MTTRAILIEDNAAAAKALCDSLAIMSDIEIIKHCTTLHDATDAIMQHRPDVLFIDIELPDGNGMEAWHAWNKRIDWEVKAVFYTSFDNYVIRALREQAFDYLLKPLNTAELQKVLDRLAEYTAAHPTQQSVAAPSDGPKRLMLNTATNAKTIAFDHNIGYFTFLPERKSWECVLDDGRQIILKRSTTAETILELSPNFVQVHKTIIINLNYLSEVDECNISLAPPFHNVSDLRLSRAYKKSFMDRFYNL